MQDTLPFADETKNVKFPFLTPRFGVTFWAQPGSQGSEQHNKAKRPL